MAGKEFSYEIVKQVAVLSKSPKGWTKGSQCDFLEWRNAKSTTFATGRRIIVKWERA